MAPKTIKINDIILPYVYDSTETEDIFLETEVFTNYIDILFKKETKLCKFNVPNINEYFIEIDVVNLSYKVPSNFYTFLKHCKDAKKKSFIIPIEINFPTNYESKSFITKSRHANVVIIDNTNIELFEPHGMKFSGNVLPYNTEEIIKKVIYKLFDEMILDGIMEKKKYVFKNVYNSCPYPGVQKQDQFCLAWTLLFIELKLLNANISSERIIETISNYKDILTYLKYYITYVKNEILKRKKVKKPHESYPETPLYDIKLTDIIDRNILEDRLKLLIKKYYVISNSINDQINTFTKLFSTRFNLTHERDLIFEELISYRKYERFHEMFFEYFNEDEGSKKRKWMKKSDDPYIPQMYLD